ncbi:uncharacterized protein LOC123037080 [Drosophila rhopaloa]|uniref:Integrase catalytic domain-containing protein n=1 Tax=Drosophila rhopaloa TaxID=1041015 RepID=A0ABM5J0Y6_DRORH|nr:uncharacterized protein LOC123037080 [Drosophila rhopaloa]
MCPTPLDVLKQKRSNIRRSISRIGAAVAKTEKVEKPNAALTPAELTCRLTILEAYFKQIMAVQTEIEALDSTEEQLNYRAELEDLFIATKVTIKDQLGDDVHNSAPLAQDTLLRPGPTSSLKLPTLALPTFAGEYAEYRNFITTFLQVVDQQEALSPIEKFNHLINRLRGAALETIKAYQVTPENYSKALLRLKSRYDNPTIVFLDNIASLFKLPTVTTENSVQLRSLVDNASALFNSLRSLGSEAQIAQTMLIAIVMEKVDKRTRQLWNESLTFAALPSWNACLSLIERHCQHLESSIHHIGNPNTAQNTSGRTRQPQAPRMGHSFTCSTQACPICSGRDHRIFRCSRLQNMSPAQRLEAVRTKSLCTNCLGKAHHPSNCPSSNRCRICSRLHHTMLHFDPSGQESRSPRRPSPTNAPPQHHVAEAVAHAHVDTHHDQIILATAIILVQDAVGNYVPGRALLDSCSQVNFMSEDFAQQLRLPRSKGPIDIRSIGDSFTRIKHRISTVKSTFHHGASQTTLHWLMRDLYQSRHIDLLLGTETFFTALSIGQIKLGPHLPMLQKTIFGWVVSGRTGNQGHAAQAHSFLSSEDSINLNLERLWRIEEVSTTPLTLTPPQAKCESIFQKSVCQVADGRLMVQLPFKDDPNLLGRSLETARLRFASLERRLSRNANLRAEYTNFMEEYERLGHMELVTSPLLNEPHYYIPHHCVFKLNSTSTKLRVVFDASCPTSTYKSLNDTLLVGPTIQPDLFTILLRFRTHRYVLTADVVKMYRQVLIDPSHRKFQYILWRSSNDQEIRTYQLNTVTYGTASAPYLAIRSLSHLANQHASSHQIGAEAIKSCFYVDDFLGGANKLDQLNQIQTEVIAILTAGKMELAKWHSNHQDFVNDTTVKELNLDDYATTSTLRLKWDQREDIFKFSFNCSTAPESITKQTILSVASSLFDPLGLVSPVIMVAKILLQEIWLLRLHWDESVPMTLQQAWLSFVSSLQHLDSLLIPRFCLQPHSDELQLHGFSDASIRGYGCCIYARTRRADGHVEVHLIVSKSRVTPTKKKTLPQLELCGAHLLARLYNQIKTAFLQHTPETFLWTDSQLVLHWIRQHSATLSTFVGNRISDIQEFTPDCQWRFVPTRHNPADMISRGCNLSELTNSTWFHGPTFLSNLPTSWPPNVHGNLDMDVVFSEKRKSAFLASTSPSRNRVLEALHNKESHQSGLRLVAWMLRFCDRCRKKNPFTTRSLSPLELRRAMLCVAWNLQQRYFIEEITLLQKGAPVRSHLKFLSPFLQITDGFNLLLVGGRLELASIPDTHKHPILLPAKDVAVVNYVRHLHLRNYHAGPRVLVGLMRLEFWVVNARDVARRVVRNCVHCVRYRPKLLQQLMGSLPVERITLSRPFARCGIDFCGPVHTYLRVRGKVPVKSYIAIFVCFATKAAHIEIVGDLSTDSFLGALKRMIARRGLPADIFCDNATNFVGASNKLQDLKDFFFSTKNQQDIISYCTNEFVTFHFIPPRAPHFGGLWEAAVKSAKNLLYRTLKDARLTFEELSTVAAETEAILNSRPLSPHSSDPSDLAVLTPGHFLTGDALRALPDWPVKDDQINCSQRWKRVSAIKQHIWRRWSTEYLHELQAKSNWTTGSSNIAVNEMVLIHEDHVPPHRWLLGRIEATIPGQDNHVRVADVRTSKGIIRRPIHKLARLPINLK